MELYREMMMRFLDSHPIVEVPTMIIDPKELVELESYLALLKIKEIIENENLNDEECFMKIEEIILLLELLGSDGGARHDFG